MEIFCYVYQFNGLFKRNISKKFEENTWFDRIFFIDLIIILIINREWIFYSSFANNIDGFVIIIFYTDRLCVKKIRDDKKII